MMMNVYLNEFNVQMEDTSYLPLTSGLLQAYAQTSPAISAHYNFKPFIHSIAPFDVVMKQYDEYPAIAAFSISMWNEQLALKVAKRLKDKYSGVLIIFGGAQCPHYPKNYMKEHSFIDLCVRAEGEQSFKSILESYLDGYNFYGIPNVTWRIDNEIIENKGEWEFSRDLDLYPSPYLEGLFDSLIESGNFQAIIETNRGCPFHCTFCYWGKGGLSRKYKYYGLERVKKELEWCSSHEIKYIFNADSNFGMNKRDQEIAEYLVDLKKRTGLPEKFRTCYGKNTDEKIFNIGALFHLHELEKGITLARQSNDEKVLKNIKRGNISMETYRNLQVRFNKKNIPIYSELILGLPGETPDTWQCGIGELLDAGLRNQLYIYFCQVYPNTDLGDKKYQEKFGIEIKRIKLQEIHGQVRDDGLVTEYEDIIVGQDSMINWQWRQQAVISWTTMLLHSLKLGFFIMEWLRKKHEISPISLIRHFADCPNQLGLISSLLNFFQLKLDGMMRGEGRACVHDGYGDIYWDVEESAFLYAMQNKDTFYRELKEVIETCLYGREYSVKELNEVIEYQKSRIPTVEDFNGDRERFARETILWGRKSGTMLLPEKEMA